MVTAFKPILRGLLWAAIGFVIGGAIAAAIGFSTGADSVTEPVIVLGYVLALLGWLLGVGMWEEWAREWFGLPRKDWLPKDWRRYLGFCTDHKVIGIQYVLTFTVIFLLGGLLAMVMRAELSSPGMNFMGPQTYNVIMSMHGIFMVAVAVAILTGGFGNYAIPLLIGAEDVAFPRVNALSYWVNPVVALLLLSSLVFGGFDAGWTAYPPLSVLTGTGELLFLLAFITFGLSSILGGLNFIATIMALRAPGMTWGKVPIFAWSILTASMISLTTTQFVAAALLTVVFDRAFGMAFYNAAEGGNPILYQHLFWFYSHPAVYVMALPGFGAVLEVLTHFSRKPLFAYKWAVSAFIGIVALSGIVWAHHMFTSGMQEFLHIPFMVLTELISVPTGLVFMAAVGTIWRGRLWMTTPMLFGLGFVFNFLIGGVTGIYLADVPSDIHFQDTYFVVAHFHYTIMGGEIFALFAALYYWFPKMTGRMYNEAQGKVHFWWMFVFYNLTFLAMFKVGLGGMNRRVADYPAALADENLLVSLFAFVLGASFIVFTYNFFNSWIRGPKAAANPWDARTLEWQTSSPPPVENFPIAPHILAHPYLYGYPNAIHHSFENGNGHGSSNGHGDVPPALAEAGAGRK